MFTVTIIKLRMYIDMDRNAIIESESEIKCRETKQQYITESNARINKNELNQVKHFSNNKEVFHCSYFIYCMPEKIKEMRSKLFYRGLKKDNNWKKKLILDMDVLLKEAEHQFKYIEKKENS